MKQCQRDPVIDEIREVRHRISARFEHDPNRLVAYYMELQKGYQDRLIETESHQTQVRCLTGGDENVGTFVTAGE